MTTPPDADDVPDTPEPLPARAWAPPDAPNAVPPPPTEAPPQPYPAPYGYGPPPALAPAPRRTNRFAVLALVTGLVGLIVFAIGFAITAFVQTGRRGEKGRGLAAGALAASAAWLAATAATAAVAVVVAAGPSGQGNAAAPDFKNGKPHITGLYIGDCFTGFEEDLNSIYVTLTQCTNPHQGEIGAVVTMPDSPYPGDSALVAEGTKKCKAQTRHLMNTRFAAHIEFRLDRPRRSAWEHGDRHITCVLLYTGSEKLTKPLTNLQWGLTNIRDLTPGDCIDKWHSAYEETTVDCNREHRVQVIAVYRMHGDGYPSKMKAKAVQGCAKELRKLYRSVSDLPGGVTLNLIYPLKEDWQSGNRRILCLFEGIGGPLRHSVMPG